MGNLCPCVFGIVKTFCVLLFCLGTKVAEKLDDIISNTTLVKDIKKMSSGHQTSSLESFHSVINQFAPKMKSYTYHGILSR